MNQSSAALTARSEQRPRALVRLALGFSTVALSFACSAPEQSEVDVLGQSTPDEVSERSVEESPSAELTLEQLRGRHQTPVLPALEDVPGAPVAALVSPLVQPNAVRFEREGGTMRPILNAPAKAEVTLPAHADGALRVAAHSGTALEVTLNGARAVAAEVADGVVVYPAAAPGGGTLVMKVREDGVEDFIEIPERPETPSVSYRVSLSEEIVGLRLVGNTLEFLDATGNPELRVAPPYVVSADGQQVDATLDVTGCEVDRDPRAPWGRGVTSPGARQCDVVVTWDGSAVSYPALLDPSWTSTENMAVVRTNHTATATVTNPQLVLVAGGWSGTAMRTSAELYNPSTKTWASAGNMANARMDHTATAAQVSGEKVLVAGGGRGTTGTATVEIYNVATGTWSAAASMPSTRFQHTAALLGNKVFVAGGTTGSVTHSNSRTYDFATNTWSSQTVMVVGQTQHSMASVQINGRNGFLVLGASSPAAQIFDHTNATWSALANQPSEGRRLAAVSSASGMWVFSGGFGPSSSVLASVEVLKNTGVWQRTGSMRYPRHSHTLSLLDFADSIAVGGGGSAGDKTEIWDSGWGTWEPAPNLVRDRYSHTATQLSPQGRTLIAGGTRSDGSPTFSAEEFDPTTQSVGTSEYKFSAAVDTEILPGCTPQAGVNDCKVELWASVTQPTTLTAGTRYPVIVMLHGNHGTCGQNGTSPRIDDNSQYTFLGTCPAGYSVVNNHRGYNYIADELAQRGYVVVSINSNRGINGKGGDGPAGDVDYILVRSRLVLRHLQLLSEWNRGARTPPTNLLWMTGRLDLSQVGLMGHSRGGEAMRGAYQLYRDAGSVWPSRLVDPVNFRGIFEIGPVDRKTSRVLNAEGTKWGVLLPMCDGDVSSLTGVRAFDRMISQLTEPTASLKATYTVWGANHNFYNTQWERSESGAACLNHRAIFQSGSLTGTGSDEQRQSGLLPTLNFFLANVGPNANSSLNQLFDPRFAAGGDKVDRGYHPGSSTSLSRQLEDFTGAAGTSTFGIPNTHSNVTVTHGSVSEHDNTHSAGTISWTASGASTFFQTNFANVGSGLNLSSYQFLDLRIDRARDDALNFTPSTNFTISLVNANDSRSTAVSIANYLSLTGPVGSSASNRHSMLQTARIPLSVFGGATLSSIRGVRLTFDTIPSGKIYVANVRATQAGAAGASAALFAAAPLAVSTMSTVAPSTGRAAQVVSTQRIGSGNRLVSVRSKGASDVELTLETATAFEAVDESIWLRVGSEQTRVSTFPGGDQRRIVFSLPRSAFDRLTGGEELVVRYGQDGDSPIEWTFGALDKSRLDR